MSKKFLIETLYELIEDLKHKYAINWVAVKERENIPSNTTSSTESNAGEFNMQKALEKITFYKELIVGLRTGKFKWKNNGSQNNIQEAAAVEVNPSDIS